MTFREATEADVPAIVILLADDTLGARREDNGSTLSDAYLQGFRRMMQGQGRIILAQHGPAVIACFQLDILHGVSQRGLARAQVEGVRVASARRGAGVGAALMAEAIRRARDAGCGVVQLTTNLARTEAQRFYRRLGFKQSHAGLKLDL